MLLFLILILIFAAFLMLFYSIFCIVFRSRQIVNIRLSNISKGHPKSIDSELSMPLFKRVIRPMLDSAGRMVLKITPGEIVASFEKKVLMAGNPYKLSAKDWINMQAVAVFCLPLATISAGYCINARISTLIFVSLVEACAGLILPGFILSKKIGERQKKITNSLPDIIDMLTVSVEAGLGFDGALAKVIEKMPGPVSEEFDIVLQEVKVGKPKKDALKDMVNRVCVQDMGTFIGSIIQAEQFGVSIGNVLRIQSEQMRQKRKQRAQEKAMKAPVKMVLPMVIFILPVIFSVLIGPIVIRMIDVFFKK